MMKITIERVSDVDGFLATIAASASEYAGWDPQMFYFHTPAWTRIMWESLEAPRGSQPFLLIARAGDTVVGWWSLVLSCRRFGYRLQNLGQEISDYATPFVPHIHQNHYRSILQGMLAMIVAERRRYSFVRLQDFVSCEHGLLMSSAEESSRLFSQLCSDVKWTFGNPTTNYFVDFTPFGGSGEVFTRQRLSFKFRKQVRYYRRKIEKLGQVEICWLATANELEPYRDSFLAFYRYQRGAADRTQRLIALWDFFREMIGGAVRINALKINGTLASLLIGANRGGSFDFFSRVFNPNFSQYSVGNVHLHAVLTDLIEADYHCSCFLVGDDDYKQHWATGNYQSTTVQYFHRSSLLACLRWLQEFRKA